MCSHSSMKVLHRSWPGLLSFKPGTATDATEKSTRPRLRAKSTQSCIGIVAYIVAPARALSDHCWCLLQEANNGSVLLVGSRQVGKHTLAKRLLQPATAADKDADGQQLWHLETKYYTTDVSIHRSSPSDYAYQQATDSQGVVLVFAADSEASFQDVSQWAEQLPTSAGEIKLCVANKADTIAAQHTGSCEQKVELRRSSWLTSAIMWCADNQYEYIEASSTNNQLDQILVREEQQQGIQRIKQALEANHWPNLVMKQPHLNHAEPSQQDSHATSQATQTADQENEDGCSSSGLSDQEGHDFGQFQAAEEKQLDQFDRMFGELRGEFMLIQLLLLGSISVELWQLMLN